MARKNDLFAVLGSLLDPNKISYYPNYPGLEKCYKFGQHKIWAWSWPNVWMTLGLHVCEYDEWMNEWGMFHRSACIGWDPESSRASKGSFQLKPVIKGAKSLHDCFVQNHPLSAFIETERSHVRGQKKQKPKLCFATSQVSK